VGSPLERADLERHRALRVSPLTATVAGHRLYNMPPPTQGLASLILLGVYARLGVADAEGFEFVHGLVEATKRAFRVRDRHVTDPAYMDVDPAAFLEASALDAMAADIDPARALPWPEASSKGDTVWLGAIDGEGRAVSFIQSIYWEFGSGTVLDETGITWQNRGVSFSLDGAHHNRLRPHRRPFHTIQPALAQLADGRVMVYGTMGGEGQPQTQAMLFARHVLHGQDLQRAVSAPRWLLGRTWGAESTNLRIENRIDPAVVEALRNAGHDVDVIGAFDEVMGHAGALVRHPDGSLEGAADPRGDGQVAAF
jgi:gamma-glutamyltranspeptidase/glutathione hydrolase